MRTSTIPALLLAFCLVATTRAQADGPPDEQAHAHFEAAQALFETGSYEEAIGEFEQAYQLSGRAQLLYNLYLCHERLGNPKAAAEQLARYLEADPDAPNAAALKVRLGKLRQRAAAAEPEAQPTPEQVPEAAEPAQDAPEVMPDAPRKGGKGKVYGPLAIGAAGLVSMAVFTYLAAKEDARLDSSCGDACSDSEVKALSTYALTADISLGVGLTGLVTAGVVWLVGRERGASPAVTVSPLTSRQHLGLSAQGHF